MNKNCPVPICPSCKNFFGIDPDIKRFCCKAFPEGIPYDNMYGSKAFSGAICNGGYGFDDILKVQINTEQNKQ